VDLHNYSLTVQIPIGVRPRKREGQDVLRAGEANSLHPLAELVRKTDCHSQLVDGCLEVSELLPNTLHKKNMPPLTYSLVIPVYNEVENILPLVEELEWVMQSYANEWELIFADDGSTDGSPELLERLSQSRPYIRCVRLKKNYGQTSAFIAGVRLARGTWVISLDGDGQNDPQDIPLLIEACVHSDSRCDLACGRRSARRDSWYKRAISKIANGVRQKVLEDNVRDTGCSLKIYRKSCLEKIPLFHGMHRFLPALFQIEGFQTKEVAVRHRKRRRGKSKYHLFNRGASLFFDMLAVAWMKKRRLRYEIEREFP
jgi:dolichol-phosphate mannosyltransferase